MKKIFLLIFSVIFSVSIYGQENDILLRNFRFYHKQEVLYREITTVIYSTLTEEVKSSELNCNFDYKNDCGWFDNERFPYFEVRFKRRNKEKSNFNYFGFIKTDAEYKLLEIN